MNPAIKQKWIEALRSGEFKQGQSYLKRDDKFCCLGILCELHRIATNDAEGWGSYSLAPFTNQYHGQSGVLPSIVQDWAGLNYHNYSTNPMINGESLSALNDAGRTFEEIAELIEKHL